MSRCQLPSIAAIAMLFLGATVQAQQQAPLMPNPRLLVVSPPGGKAGSTVEISLTGQDLDAPKELLFSIPGIKAELVNAAPPADPKKPAPNQSAPTTTIKYKVTLPADAPPGI